MYEPVCVLTEVPRCKKRGKLYPISPGRSLFEVINLDHIGPFVKLTRGNRYVLVFINNLLKYVKLYSLQNCSTDGIINSINTFILMYGLPK